MVLFDVSEPVIELGRARGERKFAAPSGLAGGYIGVGGMKLSRNGYWCER